MRIVQVTGVGGVPPAVVLRAEAELGRLPTLADVFDWARRQDPPGAVLDIVTQDEYTHDIVLPFDGAHFLAFDAT
jgi:hypothetical protein